MLLGIDIGSSTVKLVLLTNKRELIDSQYASHKGAPLKTLLFLLKKIPSKYLTKSLSVNITGSAGLGISKRSNLPFMQEVIAAKKLFYIFFLKLSH